MFKAQNNISRQTGENVLSLEHSIKMEKEKKKKKHDKETEIKRAMVSGGGGQKSLWINCSTYVINKKSSSHYYLGIPTSIFSCAFPVPTKMVFCFQNCSELMWEKLFQWEFANFLSTLEQFIQTITGQNNFWNTMFLPCSWRFLRYNTLEQL